MKIQERVQTALSLLSVPVQNGFYKGAANVGLPDSYVLYQIVDGVGAQYADDAETQRTYRVQINMFCRTGVLNMPDVTTPMKAAGFTPGPERELAYNEKTSHAGYSKDFFYSE